LTGFENIKIIYEDNHLLVVEKPVNIPSQEDESHDRDMLTILKDDIKRRFNKRGKRLSRAGSQIGPARRRSNGLCQDLKSSLKTV
jgi:23S rRNA-/tRNA-specific pseudouridylate synthase